MYALFFGGICNDDIDISLHNVASHPRPSSLENVDRFYYPFQSIENVDRFYYPFLVMVHDLNLRIFSADLKAVASYALGYTCSHCELRTLRSGRTF
jgi:hypothetical protein